MKFFFRLLSKAGKIAKVLGYVYTGMLAAESALEVLVNTLPENKIKKFRKALKYITIGAEALRKVLGWLGQDSVIVSAESEARDMTVKDFEEELARELNIEEQ